MLKRLLCGLLCLSMLQPLCPAAFAEEAVEEWEEEETFLAAADSGSFGKTFSWTLAEDGSLTVSGLGEIPDFQEGKAPWASCRDRILCVLVTDGVTGVGSHAFDGLENADTIFLGQDVERLGEYAFRNCRALKKFVLPEALTVIPAGLFYGCESLESVQIPDSVAQIGREAFCGCSSLTAMALPEGITVLREGLFRGCDALETVEIPDTVLTLEQGVFDGCKALQKAILPDGITGIEKELFRNCESLEKISIPENVRFIADSAFVGCTGLKKAELPDGVERLGTAVFQGCRTLERVTLGKGNRIPENTFQGCESLTTIELPAGLEFIEASAFANCLWLEDVELPDGLKQIGTGAFAGCGGLTEVAVPNSVTEIGGKAFLGCDGLRKVQLPENLESLEEELFRGCGALEEVKFPDAMVKIGPGAFYGCENLKIESIPAGLNSVGKGAFFGCDTAGIIDLSKLPEVMAEETVLDDLASLPECLMAVSGGQSALVWSLESYSGEEKRAKIETVQGKSILTPLSFGKERLICEDGYTGVRSEKTVEIRGAWEIQPQEDVELVSGEQMEFRLVALLGGKEMSALWSVEQDQGASITKDGLLTAEDVEKTTEVTLIAVPEWGDPVRKTVTILPRAAQVTLLMDGKPLDEILEVDMSQREDLQLSAQVFPEDARKAVQWSSDYENIAEVSDAGKVTLRRPGSTRIRARCTDGGNGEGSLELRVFYRDKASAFTLQSNALELDPGQTAQLTLMGEGPIDHPHVSYSVSGEGAASVDEQGRLTAGDTAGEIRVTAELKNDPLGRKAEITLCIREGAPRELYLVPEFPDERGYALTLEGEPRINVDVPKLQKKGYVFRLGVRDDRGREPEEVEYESTNPNLAAVSGDGTVWLQADKEGECDLIARTAGENGLEARLHLTAADSAPRLEAGKLTINSYQEAAVSTGLVENYGNAIDAVALYDYDSKRKTYGPEPSGRFRAVVTQDRLSIEALEVLKNGTYPVKMRVSCGKRCYDYSLQMKVINSFPKIDVRQGAKFNLFYLDSMVPLTISAKDCQIEKAELQGADSFRMNEDHSLTFREGYVPGEKINAKGTLRIFLEGYRIPAEKSLTVATENKPPKLTVTPGTTVFRNTREMTAAVRLEVSNQEMDLSGAELQCTSGNGALTRREEGLEIRFTGEKSGTVRFTLRLPNWASAVKLSHKVTVEKKDPVVKLGKSSLTLNRLFPGKAAQTTAGLNQRNEVLQAMRFQPSAKAGPEAEKLGISYESGTVKAQIKNAADPPKKGTYAFTYHGVLPDGTVLPAGNLKIKVESTLPKVKLGAASVKMNAFLAGEEKVRIPVTISDSSYQVAGFRELGEYEELSYEDGMLTVCLTPHSGKTTFLLTPIVEAVDGSGQAALSTRLKLGLTVYRSEKLDVSLSAKGKLDTLVPDSAIAYTVTKVSNCLGKPEDVTLMGVDAKAFQAALDTSGPKPVVRLTLREGRRYETKKTYRLRFRFSVCGKEAVSPEIRVKVTQSGLKVTAAKSLTYYLGQRVPLQWTLKPSAPVETITLNGKTDKNFREALGEMTWSGSQVLFRIAHPEKLKAGKSYTVLLDITPTGNAADVKPTQVKLTVKAAK